MNKIDKQNKEFDAVAAVSAAYKGLAPIVDDDYPQTRHRYEGGIQRLLDALALNRPDQVRLALRRESAPENRNDADFLEDVKTEIKKARAKFPEQDVMTTLVALGEEYGELCQAVLQYRYEKHKEKRISDLYSEAVQVAVMAMRVILDCEI